MSSADNSLEQRAIAAALVGATVFASVFIALQLSPDVPFPASGHIGDGASSTTGIMIIFAPLITAWAFSVHIRCPDASIRRYLKTIAALLVLWLLVVIMKYQIDSDLVTSTLWYLYYVPMTFIPALCLFSALRAATFDQKPIVRAAKRFVIVVSAVLSLFVLTNNIHFAVFSFDFNDPNWSGNYSYSWGYWVVLAWFFSLYAAFFIILFPAAHKQLRSALTPILMIGCMGASYSILYIFRFGAAITSNFSLTYSFFVILALEFSLELGILPSYAWYTEAFRKLPFDLKILSKEGETVYRTICAKDLSPVAKAALSEITSPETSFVSFRADKQPATLFKAYPVNGGTALLAENVSSIERRRKQLKLRQDALRRRNNMLENDRIVKSRLYCQERERELFEEVEHSLAKTVAEIHGLLADLPRQNNETSKAQRRHQLMLIKLLAAYCKRKGALVLAETERTDFTRTRFQLIVDETVADLRAAGIDCAAVIETDSTLPATTVSTLYDCLHDFSIAAFSHTDPVLLMHIGTHCDETVELHAILESNSTEAGVSATAAENLRTSLESHNVAFTLTATSNQANLAVVVPKQAKR